MGGSVCRDDLQFILDGRKREDILKHFFGDLSVEQARQISAIKDKYFAEGAHMVSLIPGVKEFLDLLTAAGLRVAVATSASRARAFEMLTRFDLRHTVEFVVTGEDVERGKPDPAIFRLAAAGLGLHPETAIVFEDAVSGVTAARAAGMMAIGIAHGPRSERLLDAGAAMVRPDFVGLQLLDICSIAAIGNTRALAGSGAQHTAVS